MKEEGESKHVAEIREQRKLQKSKEGSILSIENKIVLYDTLSQTHSRCQEHSYRTRTEYDIC